MSLLPTPRIDAARVLEPRSIALIGASEDIAKFGGRILHNVIRHGYAGTLLPINPRRAEVLGRTAYPDIASAPGPVDLAVIAVPAAQLRETVADCAAAGVGACVVVTAQTAEFDAAGAALQDDIVAIARAHGMRLVGPNCMGMICPAASLGLTSSMTLQHVERFREGGVALASQSGALMATLFMLAHDHGVGFSRMISVGNQADLELCDFFEAMIADAATRVICLYVEGLRDAARFTALARRAAAAGKPVLAVKAGKSETGARAARSHTASLAGSWRDFAAACAGTGISVIDEPEAMAMVAGVLERLGDIGEGGIGMIVSSGGGGAVTADRLAAAGLPLAQYGEPTAEGLARHFLPQHINNPVDLGSHKGVLVPDVFLHTIDTLARAPEVAALFYILTPQPLMDETVAGLIGAWKTSGKPLVLVLDTGSFGEGLRARLIEAGMPFVTRIDDGLRVLSVLFERRRMRTLLATTPQRPPLAGPASLPSRSGSLTEVEVKALVAGYGITTTRDTVVDSLDAARAAAARLGFPVVLKGVSETVTHKSDAGLVAVGIGDEQALATAWARVTGALAATDPGRAPRVAVMEMVRGEGELIVGARWTAFGAQVMAGAGGTMVEVEDDVAFALAPVTPDQARDLLMGLRIARRMGGVRGRPAWDVDAAVDAIVRLSWLAADAGPRLIELDINPLIVRAIGEGAVAVDARATLESA